MRAPGAFDGLRRGDPPREASAAPTATRGTDGSASIPAAASLRQKLGWSENKNPPGTAGDGKVLSGGRSSELERDGVTPQAEAADAVVDFRVTEAAGQALAHDIRRGRLGTKLAVGVLGEQAAAL